MSGGPNPEVARPVNSQLALATAEVIGRRPLTGMPQEAIFDVESPQLVPERLNDAPVTGDDLSPDRITLIRALLAADRDESNDERQRLLAELRELEAARKIAGGGLYAGHTALSDTTRLNLQTVENHGER